MSRLSLNVDVDQINAEAAIALAQNHHRGHSFMNDMEAADDSLFALLSNRRDDLHNHNHNHHHHLPHESSNDLTSNNNNNNNNNNKQKSNNSKTTFNWDCKHSIKPINYSNDFDINNLSKRLNCINGRLNYYCDVSNHRCYRNHRLIAMHYRRDCKWHCPMPNESNNNCKTKRTICHYRHHSNLRLSRHKKRNHPRVVHWHRGSPCYQHSPMR